MTEIPLRPEELQILDLQTRELSDYFGLKTREDRLEHVSALKEVIDWAKAKSGSVFTSDLILTIRGVEKNLVKNAFEPKLGNLRRYIYLEKEQAKLDSEKAAILRKPEGADGTTPS